MSGAELRGQTVSDEQIQEWADEAEAGYDVPTLRRRGRPTVGQTPGVVVTVRLDQATLDAMLARARAEGVRNRSEAIRKAVQAWTSR